MTTATIEVGAPIDLAYRIVADPKTYPRWLVGAHEIPQVDAGFPAPGTAFHHRIGFGPFVLPGSTTSERAEPPRRLDLRAGMGPLGAATVSFRLVAQGPASTRVEVDEEFVAGPVHWLWKLARPVLVTLLWGRNAVSLTALRSVIDDELTPDDEHAEV